MISSTATLRIGLPEASLRNKMSAACESVPRVVAEGYDAKGKWIELGGLKTCTEVPSLTLSPLSISQTTPLNRIARCPYSVDRLARTTLHPLHPPVNNQKLIRARCHGTRDGHKGTGRRLRYFRSGESDAAGRGWHGEGPRGAGHPARFFRRQSSPGRGSCLRSLLLSPVPSCSTGLLRLWILGSS